MKVGLWEDDGHMLSNAQGLQPEKAQAEASEPRSLWLRRHCGTILGMKSRAKDRVRACSRSATFFLAADAVCLLDSQKQHSLWRQTEGKKKRRARQEPGMP